MEKNVPGTLSVCMIVKNEANNIRDCLDCVKELADEIIVVDTGSSDHTKDIAQDCGARVFDFKWRDDFSAARNESIKHASCEWIFWIDADDRVGKEEADLLNRLKKVSPKDTVYAFEVESTMENGIKTSNLQYRFFPNIHGVRFNNRIHECVSPSLGKLGLKTLFTNLKIQHTGYTDPDRVDEKISRNLKLIDLELADNPGNALFRFYRAQTLSDKAKYSDSLEEYLRVMEIPEQQHFQRQVYEHTPAEIAKKYLELHQPDKALEWADKALSRYSENIMALYVKAEVLSRKGRIDEAKVLLQRILKENFPPHSLCVEVGLFKRNAELRLRDLS